jgi:Transposase DDE domain
MRVLAAGGKNRTVQVHESRVKLRGYHKEIRQIAIKGNGKIKPALIITNDFESSTAILVRKYARRWLVEKTISEQTHFFHLNRLSSSMVIKVDFDLVMTILAHNLYRLLALDLTGYENNTAATLYEKFIHNSGSVNLDEDQAVVELKKKRHHPALMSALQLLKNTAIPWIHDRTLQIEIASNS